MARKHISWKTKYASALAALHPGLYNDAKQMTEDQFISLFHVDHNILHESEHPDRDAYWNLMPRFIREHREKTKQDAKIIAKSRRIRAGLARSLEGIYESLTPKGRFLTPKQATLALLEVRDQSIRSRGFAPGALRSRGFDKTKTKGFDGKVRKRRK